MAMIAGGTALLIALLGYRLLTKTLARQPVAEPAPELIGDAATA